MGQINPKYKLFTWILFLGIASAILYNRIEIRSDLMSFMPSGEDELQSVLREQIRSGPASRMLMISIEGENERKIAEVSRLLTGKIKKDKRIENALNGEIGLNSYNLDFFVKFRYHLSNRIDESLFTKNTLTKSIHDWIRIISSPVGILLKDILPRDPTMEIVYILESLEAGQSQPKKKHGVWMTEDGKRALIVVETNITGMNADAYGDLESEIIEWFNEYKKDNQMDLNMTGPGIFAARSKSIIQSDITFLAIFSTIGILGIMYFAYRSLNVVFLGIFPVITGLVTGLILVDFVFGYVHGITLAFGATIIGEAIDYPGYLFANIAQGEHAESAFKRIRITLRLAVMTTVFGTAGMLFSGLEGLVQLGLLTISGVFVAGFATSYLLPGIVPESLGDKKIQKLPYDWSRTLFGFKWNPVLIYVLLISILIHIVYNRENLWNDSLSAMNPVSEDLVRFDRNMRKETGVPDMNHILLVGPFDSIEELLINVEALEKVLIEMSEKRQIVGFRSLSGIMPSKRSQKERLEKLPEVKQSRLNIKKIVRETPFHADVFEPFFHDLAELKARPYYLDLDTLVKSPLRNVVQSMLVRDGNKYYSIIPVTTTGSELEGKNFVADINFRNVSYINIKNRMEHIIATYRKETLFFVFLGFLGIAMVIFAGTRSIKRTLMIIEPIFISALITAGLSSATGDGMNIFQIVSLLLVVGIGTNYALFFEKRNETEEDYERTLLSLTICSSTTLLTFGALSFSRTPVLHSMGSTVALGSMLSLMISGMLINWRRKREEHSTYLDRSPGNNILR